MIITVTPNPAIDVTYSVDGMRPGESHRIASGRARAGGKGLNVARVIQQQGGLVLALTTAGGRAGEELEADLRGSGIRHVLVRTEAPTRHSIAIVDRLADQTTVLNERGAPQLAGDGNRLLEALAAALDGEPIGCIVGSGSLPPGIDPEFYGRVVEAGRQRGIPVIIDATGRPLLLAAAAGATVLKPNREELADATGVGDPETGARVLLELGARVVFVSLGADGMLAVTPDASWHARLPRPLEGNPTGAGDAAVAAIASSLNERLTDVPELLRRATAWSAAAVLMPQAGEIAPCVPHDVIVTEEGVSWG